MSSWGFIFGDEHNIACSMPGNKFLFFEGDFKVEQNTNTVQKHEDTKKLSIVVLFLGLLVAALFGLAPIA